jgi:hypothetical protein
VTVRFFNDDFALLGPLVQKSAPLCCQRVGSIRQNERSGKGSLGIGIAGRPSTPKHGSIPELYTTAFAAKLAVRSATGFRPSLPTKASIRNFRFGSIYDGRDDFRCDRWAPSTDIQAFWGLTKVGVRRIAS